MKKFFTKKQTAVLNEENTDELSGYDSYTEKEIFSQPELVRAFTDKHIRLGNIRFDNVKIPFDKIKRLYLVGNGGNYACALAAAYNAEVLCDVTASARSITEFVHSNPILDKTTLVIIFAESSYAPDCIQAVSRIKSSSARSLFILSNDEEKSNMISVGMSEKGKLPCPSFLLKYLAASMLFVYIGDKNKVITNLYKTVALNAFLALSKQLDEVFSAQHIISQAAERINYESLSVTGINIDLAQSIYASMIFTAATGNAVLPYEADSAAEKSNLLAITSCIDLNEALLQRLTPSIVVLPDNLKLQNITTISYEETIPLLNPVISTAVLQLIAYHMLKKTQATD